jgi:solute carrier family 45, member 1/2/4
MASKSDVDEDAELSRIRATVRQWRVEAAQKGKPLELPVMPFLLRNVWTASLVLFGFLNFSTFFIGTVVQVSSFYIDADIAFTYYMHKATVYISLVGICWAVAMWVPFAIVMEVKILVSVFHSNLTALGTDVERTTGSRGPRHSACAHPEFIRSKPASQVW